MTLGDQAVPPERGASADRLAAELLNASMIMALGLLAIFLGIWMVIDTIGPVTSVGGLPRQVWANVWEIAGGLGLILLGAQTALSGLGCGRRSWQRQRGGRT
jgi:hypothetical protein